MLSTRTEYQKKLDGYLKESKNLTPLEKHLFLFIDKDKTFSPSTVSEALEKMHGSKSKAKGTAIASFNATHASSNYICPAFKAQFTKDKNGYARFLHLGTTRIWNADGSINQERLKKFEDYIAKESKEQIITKNTLTKYLNICKLADKPESTTGRNADSFFSSQSTQELAGSAAWDEVFDRLACGWKPRPDDYREMEPYLSLEVLRDFFIDSPKAFLKAECGLLPVAKPEPKSPEPLLAMPYKP